MKKPKRQIKRKNVGGGIEFLSALLLLIIIVTCALSSIFFRMWMILFVIKFYLEWTKR